LTDKNWQKKIKFKLSAATPLEESSARTSVLIAPNVNQHKAVTSG